MLERPIAHRGLHCSAQPENSIAAIEAAARAGYPAELDVHLTADREVVVFHDDTLDRMTGKSGRIGETPYAALQGLRLANTAEAIPRLSEVLAVVDSKIPLVVELKNSGRSRDLETAVAGLLRDYPGPVALQSFNPFSLAWLGARGVDRPLGLLASSFEDAELARYKKFILRRLFLAPWVVPSYIGYDIRSLPYWAPAVARHIARIPVVAWTIRTDEQRVRARRWADNYIFERE